MAQLRKIQLWMAAGFIPLVFIVGYVEAKYSFIYSSVRGMIDGMVDIYSFSSTITWLVFEMGVWLLSVSIPMILYSLVCIGIMAFMVRNKLHKAELEGC